jgi:ATP-dependent Clp protease adapter protein ClpS
MTKHSGYFKLASFRGIALNVHWSFPGGGLLISIFGRSDPHVWVYYCLAYSILVLIHECGHVAAARLFGLKVFTVDITGMGGLCRFERPYQIKHSALIYSAGLLAQILAFVLTAIYLSIFRTPKGPAENAFIVTFTFVNFILFVINLIPQRGVRTIGTDGYLLWRLFLHVYKGHPHPHPPLVVTPPDRAPVFLPETRLVSKPEFFPHGFIYGIEILNDKTTPMEFVVDVLMRHLEINREEAVVKMLDIHNTGGMLIGFATAWRAHEVADAITSEAKAAGHPFVCRYVDIYQANQDVI